MFSVPLPDEGKESWGPEVWDSHVAPRARRYVDFVKSYYGGEGTERFQLAIMLSIASPFMAFVTGEYRGGATLPVNSSLTVSLYSRGSGRGKTTAAKVAVMAYGNPAGLSNDSGKAGATVNARIGPLSLHGTMPNIMDEMSDLSPSEVATTVSSVATALASRR